MDSNTHSENIRKIRRALITPLLVSFGVSFVSTILSLAIPIYTIQIFTRVLNSRSSETLILLTIAVFISMLSYSVIDELRKSMHRKVGHWLAQRLSTQSLESLLRQTLERKDIVGRAFNDLRRCHDFVSGPNIPSAFDLIWSPLFILVLFLLHPGFAIICAIAFIVMAILGVINEFLIHGPQEDAARQSTQASVHLQTAMRGSETIEAMGILEPFAHKWQKDYMAGLNASGKATTRASIIKSLSSFCQGAAIVAIIALAAHLIITDRVGGGTLIAAMIVARLALKPFGTLIANWRDWVGFHGAVQRLVKDLAPSTQRGRSTMDLPRPDGGLAVERVVFVPPGASKAILHGVSFTVAEGEAVGIVGASGSGKTTLMRLLVGVYGPTSGRVVLGGHEVFTWERTSFGRHVGFLSQDVELFPATVAENIARLRTADPSSVIWAAKEAGIHELIGTLPHGYSTHIGPGGHPLTRGQQQRIGLARALFGNPSLLVLDEPDASLDKKGEQALHAALVRAKNRGACVVVVTHRTSVLPALDKVVVLGAGRVVAVLSPGDAAALDMPDGDHDTGSVKRLQTRRART